MLRLNCDECYTFMSISSNLTSTVARIEYKSMYGIYLSSISCGDVNRNILNNWGDINSKFSSLLLPSTIEFDAPVAKEIRWVFLAAAQNY